LIEGTSASVVLADQVKSVGWRSRKAKVSEGELAAVLAKLRTLL
jgi:mRNA-degrading endonuclease toxin of MazEF toxin-antitoxin module